MSAFVPSVFILVLVLVHDTLCARFLFLPNILYFNSFKSVDSSFVSDSACVVCLQAVSSWVATQMEVVIYVTPKARASLADDKF